MSPIFHQSEHPIDFANTGSHRYHQSPSYHGSDWVIRIVAHRRVIRSACGLHLGIPYQSPEPRWPCVFAD